MNDRCRYCNMDADYIIQWGPKVGEKDQTCADHVSKLLDFANVPETWVVRIKKT